MKTPDWLSITPHASLLESLHRMAWIDGTISAEERRMLQRLVSRLGLKPLGIELHIWLEDPASSGLSVPDEADPFAQRFLLSCAIEMAYEDGEYDQSERMVVERWAAAWNIQPDEVREIEAGVIAEHGRSDGFSVEP